MVTTEVSRVMALVEAIDQASPLLEFGELALELCEGQQLSNEELEELQANCDNVRIERSAEGVLRVGGQSGWLSDQLEDRLRDAIKAWIATDGHGMSFGSAAGSYLPNTSALTPDLSWRPAEQLPPAGDMAAWQLPQYGAAPFVVEVQSRNQSAPYLRRKMTEWIEAGVQLGWLIIPLHKQVEIYRPDRAPEVLLDPETLSGEDVMPGLVIAMSDVWI